MWLYDFFQGLDLTRLLLFVFIFLLIADYPPNFPPGPRGLPLLGSDLSMDFQRPHEYLTKLSETYGNVFHLRLGRTKTVVVCGYKMVKEAIVTNAESFMDMMIHFAMVLLKVTHADTRYGLFASSGERWKTHRRFGLSTLHTFGLGKNVTEQSIIEELRNLQEEMVKEKEKVQAEIDQVIGQNRLPAMSDRTNMPYTDAVIHEIQRFGNIVPLNILRSARRDTMVGGYFIPKGTTVLPMLTSVLYNKSEWETPDTFNPGHFLDSHGRFVKRDAFLAFSAGKRVCLGEGLAKMELFLFLVGLLQKFSFSAPEGVDHKCA
ncbi:LOW QUALITY PROTEIN: cytochrome P450 2K1-like [Synchiropus picturatus]